MKIKKPDIFEITKTPDTSSSEDFYSVSGTPSSISHAIEYAQKNEIAHLKEIFEVRFSSLVEKLKNVEDSLTGRETRFWVINGLIVTVVVAIFLYALPDLYKKDYVERITDIHSEVNAIDNRVNVLEIAEKTNK